MGGFPHWAWPLIFLPIIIAALMIPILMATCGCWPTSHKRKTVVADGPVYEDSEEPHRRLVHGSEGSGSSISTAPLMQQPRELAVASLQGNRMDVRGPSSVTAARYTALPTAAPGPYLMR